jgi:hypothetical protein
MIIYARGAVRAAQWKRGSALLLHIQNDNMGNQQLSLKNMFG